MLPWHQPKPGIASCGTGHFFFVIARRLKADAAIQLKIKQVLDCFAALAMTDNVNIKT
jgi:hypothetical protein